MKFARLSHNLRDLDVVVVGCGWEEAASIKSSKETSRNRGQSHLTSYPVWLMAMATQWCGSRSSTTKCLRSGDDQDNVRFKSHSKRDHPWP